VSVTSCDASTVPTPAQVTVVAAGSPAWRAGLQPGDELLSVNGRAVRDVIEYAIATDDPAVELVVRRHGAVLASKVRVDKAAGQPLGIEVSSPVFDRVRTCDNHCPFCFIHQLPKGMRRSLYLKDDDYRLSFLYGNFTTLTRFTELDAERVIEQRLGPLFVSIHATDPEVRARMLRNPRGATSLRWLRVLLDAGIEVHGQIVVCPDINDGAVLESTLNDILDEYDALATVGVVPLGTSRHTREPELRAHSPAEAGAVCAVVEEWQGIYQRWLGRRLVFCADEYYLLADRPFPPASAYDGFPQHENGIGMARSFIESFGGQEDLSFATRAGFFASVDGAPATGYRAGHLEQGQGRHEGTLSASVTPTAVLTGTYGAAVIGPLIRRWDAESGGGWSHVRLVPVENRFFGGNIGVAGLLTGSDLARALADEPVGHRYLLPDACLSGGRFLDGLTLDELPRPVEVLQTDGSSLRRALAAVREGGDR
jgi:putative radical SAM enzyme (TIGR03279 family)